MSRPFRILIVLALVCASSALAREKKTVLGVFLPTTMADGQQRFDLAEKLASALGTTLGRPVVARNFGRYEDFSKAVGSGQVDVAIVDAWAAVQLDKGRPIALGEVSGEALQRWAIVSYRKGAVKDLSGRRLVVPRGARAFDAKFVTNVMFGGDFDARKNFHLVSVPNVESALRLLASKGAEAALVPAMHAPDDARVLYRSAALPGVVALNLHGDAEDMEKAITALAAVAPIDHFTAANPNALAPLHTLLVKGPPQREPVMAESPAFPLDTAPLISFHDVGFTLPSFVDQIEAPREQPDP